MDYCSVEQFESYHIVVIGVGGTGGDFAASLARMVSGRRDVKVTLIDGDIVEDVNIHRQPYSDADIGINKADILAQKINATFDVNFQFVPEYVSEPYSITRLFSGRKDELPIIIGTVDNHPARILMERAFLETKNSIYVDSANEDVYGDVIVGVRGEKETLLRSRGMYRPQELFKGTERIKDRSCERKTEENPQQIATNKMASNILLSIMSDLLNHLELRAHFVNFDLSSYDVFQGVQGVEADADEHFERLLAECLAGDTF